MSEMTRARACDLFSALSHPGRLRIVEMIVEGPRTVGEVAAEMGIGASGASQHLTMLARVGIVVAEARGTSRIYRIRGPRIAAILNLIEEFCEVNRLFGSAAEENGADQVGPPSDEAGS